MKFIDEAVILVESGHGGRGGLSFRREKFVPKGGPDGGNGGKGGDVVLRASLRKRTLYDFTHRRSFKAENGKNGSANMRTGRDGDDLIIEIPAGTMVLNAQTGELIHDFTQDDEQFVLLAGGRGGKGNAHFKTATHQTPRFSQPGEPGKSLEIKLVLKLIADVGLVGLPNAGKSTLLSAISAATPKIADYPFTTLVPNLAVVYPPNSEPFIAADIPGLIEGAHTGAGLGTRFLRHIERTRILVHLLDASVIDPQDPLHDYRTIEAELHRFNPSLSQKPRLIVLNKLDVAHAEALADRFEEAVWPTEVFRISAKTGMGTETLIRQLARILDHHGMSRS
uniref:GTPase Obg n=1 Tax=Desulfatirhabdium butyrativorans TaxID=340467 RepID=A0A7C4VT60_9BACT